MVAVNAHSKLLLMNASYQASLCSCFLRSRVSGLEDFEATDMFVQLVICSKCTACHMSTICWRVLYNNGTSIPARVQVKLVAILCKPWGMRG